MSAARRVLVAVSKREREQFQIDTAFAGQFVSRGTADGGGSAESAVELHVCLIDGSTEWESLLQRLRPEVLVAAWSTPSLPVGYLDAQECPLKYVCFLTGSVRRLVSRAFIERGGVVTNWGSAVGLQVAEHALLLLLAALRRLPEWRPYLVTAMERQATHALSLPTRTLHGRTVAMHGFGQIAREFIRLVAPFNVKVRAYSEGVPADYMRKNGAEPVAALETLFDGAEILIECEALNPRTEQSVNAAMLDRLARGAIFVNVGRGAVVDEAALIERATRGDVQLALDVFASEPPPKNWAMFDVPGAVLSPHIGGPTLDSLSALGLRAADNVCRYFAGEAPQHPLTVDVYDRAT